jgi:hypothetical protein
MQRRVDDLSSKLAEERRARERAEAELDATNQQLAALEKVLGLSAPSNLPSNRAAA